jgi:hypothetical protein
MSSASKAKRKREEERLSFTSPGKKTVAPAARRTLIRRPLPEPEPESSDEETDNVGNIQFHVPVDTSFKSKVIDLLEQFKSRANTSENLLTDECDDESGCFLRR